MFLSVHTREIQLVPELLLLTSDTFSLALTVWGISYKHFLLALFSF